jgi:hypothetical protein
MRVANKLTSLTAVSLLVLASACSESTPPPTTGFGRGGSSGSGSGGSGGSSNSGSGGSSSGSGGSSSSGGGSSGSAGSGGSSSSSGGSSGGGGSGGSSSSSGGSSGSGGSQGQPDAPVEETAPLPPALPLPVVVTDVFNNQGWFGDPSIMGLFAPGLIAQGPSTAGPCASRPTGAKGQCLEVTYTPPATYMKPEAGATWLGVFFLTTLTGGSGPNWGAEPGKRIAAGAKKISFYAASPTDGLQVAFKAGAMDGINLPDQVETLGTAWAQKSISLDGQSYDAVVGGFAWIITDLTKPAKFYLDSIVWE